MGIQIRSSNSVVPLEASERDALNYLKNPFVSHAFLSALERSGSVGQTAGWQVCMLEIWQDNDQLVGILPAWIKLHSYGEYVFDWSWADAAMRAGIDYYPKLVVAVPFTPSMGPRFLTSADFWQQSKSEQTEWGRAIGSALDEWCQSQGLGSWHVLFADSQEHDFWRAAAGLERLDCQYYWSNQGWSTFGDFLEALQSRKRKEIRKERQQMISMGFEFEHLTGSQITARHMQVFYEFYRITYLKRSGHAGYLQPTFFTELARNLAAQVLLVFARQGSDYIAGSLFFFDRHQLYGRYWGTLEEYDGLHFECCYYQGLDFALARSLRGFDSGAQGEHKIKRGFAPRITRSFHRFLHAGLESSIRQFCDREAPAVLDWRESCRSRLPYHAV
ncbi:MAG: GNAT family N-acetyltransferase [Leptospiraceae bacterium]|nr:GNAT family N-acetyltransferase [Leptospiraceae bacterium]